MSHAAPEAPSSPTGGPQGSSTGPRIGAAFIDLAVYTALWLGVFFAVADSSQGLVFFESFNTHIVFGDTVYYVEGAEAGLFWALVLGAAGLYFGLIPGLLGWTPGKLVTGVRVVSRRGTKAGVGAHLVRALLWVVDGFPYFLPGLVGFILVLAKKDHRRVADMAAGTYVVRADQVGRAVSVQPAGEDFGPPAPAWYPDPRNEAALRWWDGARWTEYVHPR
jgi:uncharacterized RDD family membrane protein YckC